MHTQILLKMQHSIQSHVPAHHLLMPIHGPAFYEVCFWSPPAMKREQNYVVVVGTNLDHRAILPTPVSVRTLYSELLNLQAPFQ